MSYKVGQLVVAKSIRMQTCPHCRRLVDVHTVTEAFNVAGTFVEHRGRLSLLPDGTWWSDGCPGSRQPVDVVAAQ